MPMDDHPNKLSVLIPVYNEEKTVEEILDRVLALGAVVKEIVVVDDGSKDRTAELVRVKATQSPKIQFHQAPKNQGKTAAIKQALALATGDVIIIQDADLEYDPAEIPEVIDPILRGQADVVFGSRFLVRKAARVLYFYHYLANTGLTFLCNMLTNRNMTDIETCYKAFRKEVIKPLDLTSRGFGMEVEITAMICKTRARTYEVPISYYGRAYEEGKKIGPMDGVAALWYIFFYNIIKPFTSSGRAYIRAVNEKLIPER
jgi:glycosyltransferase involved in cell wall biosynthesis